MHENLRIIHFPDPRLRKMSTPVESFDENLRALAARMLELMRQDKGVGLAAPQVGINLRLFVMNHDGQPGNDRVIVNPVLEPLDGESQDEEGCLSIPEVRIKVWRADKVRLKAVNEHGQPIDETADGFITRIWQHENDHLDGILLTDKMGALDKLAYRKKLTLLKDKYEKAKSA